VVGLYPLVDQFGVRVEWSIPSIESFQVDCPHSIPSILPCRQAGIVFRALCYRLMDGFFPGRQSHSCVFPRTIEFRFWVISTWLYRLLTATCPLLWGLPIIWFFPLLLGIILDRFGVHYGVVENGTTILSCCSPRYGRTCSVQADPWSIQPRNPCSVLLTCFGRLFVESSYG